MHTIDHLNKKYTEMTGRSMIDVAIRVLTIIPDTESTIKMEICKLCKDFSNHAPEVLQGSYCWVPFVNILNKHITVFDAEWKKSILEIINNNA
jgi:hypothetical protein